MNLYDDTKIWFNNAMEEKAYDFVKKLEVFLERDEHLLCELIRMDATKKLLQKESPEILEMVSNPAAEKRLYRAMKEASTEVERFLIRPFPGGPELFHELFEMFLSLDDVKEFLKAIINEGSKLSHCLPEHVCNRAFESVENSSRIRVFEPDLFFSCLFYKIEEMKDKEFYLYPPMSDEKGVGLFIKYMIRDYSNVRYIERRTSAEIEKGNYVVLSATPRRLRLRMLLPVKRKIKLIGDSPEGVRFFMVVPRNFLSSTEMTEEKAFLASFRIEKIFFWSGIRLSDLGAILFVKKPAKKYKVEVIAEGKRINVDSDFLKTVPVWTREFLVSEEKEEVLKFFLAAKKVKLEDIAEVRRGYFIRKRDEVIEDENAPRILSVGDIEGAVIDPNKLSKIKLKDDSELQPLKPGDIVISARGTAMKAAIIPETNLRIYPSDSVIVISPKDYPSNLLRFFLTSPVGERLLINTRRSGALLSILPSDVRKIPVPVVPSGEIEKVDAMLKKAEEDYVKKIQEVEEEYRSRIKAIEEKLFGK